MRAALNELATVAPDWLTTIAPDDWYMHYGMTGICTTGGALRTTNYQSQRLSGMRTLSKLAKTPTIYYLA